MSDSYSSSSYYYSSTTSSNGGAATTGHRYTTASYTDLEGNTVVRTAHQDLGQPAVVEERLYDRTGHEQMIDAGVGSSAGGTRVITDLDDEDVVGGTAYDAGTGYGASLGDDSSHETTYTPSGVRVVDRNTGAHAEDFDIDTDGVRRHHVEGRDDVGRTYHEDLDIDKTGYPPTGRVHREYQNPQTGVQLHRDTDVELSDVV